MSGDLDLSLPSDRGGLGIVDRILGRFVRVLGWVRSSALGLLHQLSPRVDRAVRGRPRTRIGQLATARSDPPRTPAAPHGRVRMRGAGGAPRFSTLRVAPEFSPRDYRATFAALQAPAGSKLLDLVPARLLCADLFEDLAAAWTVERETVPRLGILVAFERWVMLRDAALAQLQPLAARGVRVEVFYAEQASAGYLTAWFAHGQVVHNVSAAIATLAAHWQPAEHWPLVIETLYRLARAHTSAAELPVLVTQLAGLALSCGDAMRAAALAQEALYSLPGAASPVRCEALRELGTSMICQGQIVVGIAFLDQAFAMAAQVNVPDIGASALCHSGLCALNHGDYAGAERRFRGAIALLSATVHHAHLHALACHSLAVALLHLRRLDEAERYAHEALALRPDPTSHLAEEDQSLLARLRQLRSDGPTLTPVVLGSAPEAQPPTPEADV